MVALKKVESEEVVDSLNLIRTEERDPFKHLRLTITSTSQIPRYFGPLLDEKNKDNYFDPRKVLKHLSLINTEHAFCEVPNKDISDKRAQVIVVFKSSDYLSNNLFAEFSEAFSKHTHDVSLKCFYILSPDSYDLFLASSNTSISEITSKRSDESEKEHAQNLIDIISSAADVGVSDIHIEIDFASGIAEILMRHMKVRGHVMNVKSEIAEIYIRFLYGQTKNPRDATFSIKTSNGWSNDFVSIHDRTLNINLRYSQAADGDNKLSCVMRIFTRKRELQEISGIDLIEGGLLVSQAEDMKSILLLNSGHINVSGVVGSGKTMASREFVKIKKSFIKGIAKVFAIEDPAEHFGKNIYNMDPNQYRSRGENGLKNIVDELLRQDGDLVIPGEIRNQFNGKIALETYYMGKLSIATIHSPNALMSIQKLETIGGWGKEAYNNNAVIANMHLEADLLLCPHCSLTFEEFLETKTGTLFYTNDIKRVFDSPEYLRFKSNLRFHNEKGCEYCSDKSIAEFKPNITIDFSKHGYKRLTWNAEVLVSDDILFNYIDQYGFNKTQFFYSTIYRVLSDKPHKGLKSSESAFHKMLHGEICPKYFIDKYGLLSRFITTCESYSSAINDFLKQNGFEINNGKGFKFSDYLYDLNSLSDWQKELVEQGAIATRLILKEKDQ